MKKTILLFACAFAVLSVFGQSEKYMKTMKEKVASIDSTWGTDKLKALSGAFERIGDAEKTQWLPYYYAALTQVNMGLSMSEQGAMPAEKVDPIADKAEALLAKASAISKDNAEILIVKKMITNLRMMPGEMDRYMKYGPEGATAMAAAKKLSPENPRIFLLEAQDKFFTPEQFGGSKAEAKKLFEEALKKFESFKPASEIDPSWGRSTAQYFLTQIQ